MMNGKLLSSRWKGILQSKSHNPYNENEIIVAPVSVPKQQNDHDDDEVDDWGSPDKTPTPSANALRPIPCVASPKSIATDGDAEDSPAESSQAAVVEREGDAEADDGDETALYHDADDAEGEQGEGAAEAAAVENALRDDLSEDFEDNEGTGADCEEGDPHDHDVVDGGEDEEEEENEAEEGIADPKVAGDVVDSDSDNEDDLPYQELPAFAGFVSQEALRVLTHHTQNTSRLSEIAELAAAVADSPCPASDAIVHLGNPTPFQRTHSTEVPSSTSGNGEDTPSSTSTRSEREQT
ncbi:unnamed protein product [Vitrella brassicaformis CCMP3155]|uniref:Uncharacterized protein n=1 Tax=Vitrella brassicaformis (strain CCMP3155) TaxID=1169540 RepID=A0A0G4F615_VITBC|nr:unnamed protein product [Vitrella brassicaformis CCMP3155]|eukprot:CEM07946.1 unnamed protein product [Vitrella brassicaformis CCMP3155]